MDPQQAAKLVTDTGMGVASFVALLYGGWRLLKWLDEVKEILETIKGNHLHTIEASMVTLVDNSSEANKKLDVHGQMLGIIVDQTKKDV